jgi:hypothetical protein
MSPRCETCKGALVVLETLCTDPYSNGMEWYRDIKKRCVCQNCGREQEIKVDTVKQDRLFK